MAKKPQKSPAFQFYPKDFLTDEKVVLMSPEVVGLYIKLLCHDWLEDGFLPENMSRLSGWEWRDHSGNLRSQEDHDRAMAMLEKCFQSHPEKSGFVTNNAIQKRRAEQEENRKRRVRAGKKGADSKWNQGVNLDGNAMSEGMAKGMAKDGSPSPTPTPTASASPKLGIYTHTPAQPEINPPLEPKPKPKPKRTAPIFDPTGKKKYHDWVYLDDEQLERVKSYYQRQGCGPDEFWEAVRALDRWFENNPKMRPKRSDDAKALMGWPLDAALERKRRLIQLDNSTQFQRKQA